MHYSDKIISLRILLNDIFIVVLLTYVTSLILEQVYPGFVSSVIDLNSLLISVLLLAAISISGRKLPGARSKWLRIYLVFFALGNLFLLQRLFTLQFSRALLGLSLSILLISAIITSFILIYDRRSNN